MWKSEKRLVTKPFSVQVGTSKKACFLKVEGDFRRFILYLMKRLIGSQRTQWRLCRYKLRASAFI